MKSTLHSVEQKLHSSWCDCADCNPRMVGDPPRWLPSPLTAMLCLIIAAGAIIINYLSF